MRTLYQLTIKKNIDFYVIATSPSEAQDELRKLLDKAEYWFSDDRQVINIKIVANEYHCFPKDRPSFSDKGGELIIVQENDH